MKNTFKPHMLPYDFSDAIIGTIYGCIFWIIFIGVPSCIIVEIVKYYYPNPYIDSYGLLLRIIIMLSIIFVLIFLVISVKEVTIDDKGIMFRKTIAGEIIISKEDINSISRASIWEVMLDGILLRETTFAYTLKNDVKIIFNDDNTIYFPPKDLDEFINSLKENGYDSLLKLK